MTDRVMLIFAEKTFPGGLVSAKVAGWGGGADHGARPPRHDYLDARRVASPSTIPSSTRVATTPIAVRRGPATTNDWPIARRSTPITTDPMATATDATTGRIGMSENASALTAR